MTPIKEILRLFLTFVLPFIFAIVKTKFPDFPLNQDTFAALLIWAIGLLIGGWQFSVALRNIIIHYFKTKEKDVFQS